MIARNKFMFLLITLMIVQFSNAMTKDYCNVKSCMEKKPLHVACLYKSTTPARHCSSPKVYQVGLSKAEKNRIVELHNQFRQKVARGDEKRGKNGPQPAAKKMPNLEWDNELEILAQRWANQCPPKGHDKCRNVDRFNVGQNINSLRTDNDIMTVPVDVLINSWSDEVENFDKNDVSALKPTLPGAPLIAHYTQMVRAETTKIGCGAIKYKDSLDELKRNRYYLVCNYGPGGNYENEPLYIKV